MMSRLTWQADGMKGVPQKIDLYHRGPSGPGDKWVSNDQEGQLRHRENWPVTCTNVVGDTGIEPVASTVSR